MSWTIRSVLAWSKSYLKDKAVESPRLDAEILLAHSLSLKRIDLYLDMDRPLMEDELQAYRGSLKRRAQREPIAYILGEKEFYGRSFKVNQDVLIPRPETEILVEQACLMAPRQGRILELGVGSGAVIISILCERHDVVGFGSDIQKQPIIITRENAHIYGIENRLHLFVGRSFFSIYAQFDTIIMNPPYIALSSMDMLEQDILKYEPYTALFGGKDGLDIIKEILMDVSTYMRPGGKFIMETGYDQSPAVESLIKSHKGLFISSWIKDLSGHNRVVIMEKVNG